MLDATGGRDLVAASRQRTWADTSTPADEEFDRQDGVELLQLVADSVSSGTPRRVLVLHLSQLPTGLSKPHHLRLARAALDPLSRADRARLFRLANMDLVMVWRGIAEAELQASLRSLATLFIGDLLPRPDLLTKILSLPRDARLLCDVAAASLDRRAIKRNSRLEGEPLDPTALARLEERLVGCDLTSFARRRAICGVGVDGRLALRWERRLLSVTALASALMPGRSLRADPWLFRRLTRALDRRMLALLASAGEMRDAGPFSIDLNVGSILAPEFLRFDAALPALLRGRVVLNLLAFDVLADPGAFTLARDFARARQYRLLLRGVDPALLPVLPPRRLGVDLLELRWPAAPSGPPDPEQLGEPSQIVLTRVTTPAALEWGLSHGVALFEGPAALAPSWEPPRPSRNIALGGMPAAA